MIKRDSGHDNIGYDNIVTEGNTKLDRIIKSPLKTRQQRGSNSTKRVKDIMTKDVPKVSRNSTILEAVEAMNH